MPDYLIYGAGGHAKVLKDLIEQSHGASVILCFFNDNIETRYIDGIPIIPYQSEAHSNGLVVLGIGSGRIRKELASKVNHRFAVLIHPTAIIAHDVAIGEGTVVLAGAVIQTGVRIGKHVIVNAHVTIDHDVEIGDYAHIYPGAYVGSEVKVREGTVINPNAVLMRFTETKAWSEIRAGEICH